MARRPYREMQTASVASYAICSDRRARISPRWRTTRRHSSPPRRRPSPRHPSQNVLPWQRRAPMPPSWRREKQWCPSPHLSEKRAPSRRARPRARRLPCLVARRRPFLPEASRIASVLGVKRDRQLNIAQVPADFARAPTRCNRTRWRQFITPAYGSLS